MENSQFRELQYCQKFRLACGIDDQDWRGCYAGKRYFSLLPSTTSRGIKTCIFERGAMKLLSTVSILILGAQLAAAATKQFTITITAGKAAPDGVERDVYFVNGKTPGPPIEVTQGDDVEVTVINNVD
ncbi:hypothetical protein FRC02_002431, partial [Tulasnella sp. 418]